MRRRLFGCGVLICLLSLVFPFPADASDRDRRHPSLESLSVAQAKQQIRFFHGVPQAGSPEDCRDAGRFRGVFLLPTGAAGSTGASFRCTVNAGPAILDLGSFLITEDDRFGTGTDENTESFFTLPGGRAIPYSRENLPLICRLSVQVIPFPPGDARLDGVALAPTLVSTRNFTIRLNNDRDGDYLDSLNQDAIDLGHPGSLTACTTGYKVLVQLTLGHHTIVLTKTSPSGQKSTFTYELHVRR